MTKKEKKQHRVSFINAGRKAWRLGIDFNNNPYKESPYNELWRKGFRMEKSETYARRNQFKQQLGG